MKEDSVIDIGIGPLAAALNACASYTRKNLHLGAPLMLAKCRALLKGYHAKWANADMDVASVEEMLTAGLYNPESKRQSRTFLLAGKLDVRMREQANVVIMDHKTTSDDIVDPQSPLWRQLIVESQLSQYMLLDWLNGRKADYGIWDVIRKPTIAPRKLSKKDAESVIFTKRYLGIALTEDDVREFSADPETRETLAMYETRLTIDCISERPEWYFQRRRIPRLDSDILEHAGDMWDHGQEIIQARRLNRWPKNSKACLLYGSPCKFLGICSGHDEPNSDNWKRKPSFHEELPDLPNDGRGFLTNSAIGTFQTCRKKYFYEYELGIERNDEDEREALYFGTLIHEGLAAWFSYFIPPEEQDANGNHERSASGNEPETAIANT